MPVSASLSEQSGESAQDSGDKIAMDISMTAERAYTLNSRTMDALLELNSGNAALVYLYLLKHEGKLEKTVAQSLGMDAAAFSVALEALGKAGLVRLGAAATVVGDVQDKPSVQPSDIAPGYSSREIASMIDADADFSQLVKEAERRLSKVLSSSDLQILCAIVDWRGLPADVVSLLLAYCTDASKRRYPQRSPTMKQIDRLAAQWERDGIDSVERAVEYINAANKRADARVMVQTALGIHGRELVAAEQKYIDAWLEMGFSEDMIRLAYEKTVLNTGGMKWPYMNSILSSWRDQSIFSPDALQRGEKPKKAVVPSRQRAYELSAPEKESLARAAAFLRNKSAVVGDHNE